MIRVILLCTAVASASVGGDYKTENSTNPVAKREILEFYPDWVPFKNKRGDELGEFVDVNKPKAKVKKRLALPMNFELKAVADDDTDYDAGAGESDDDTYFDKKDWSDVNRPVFNVSKPESQQQDKVSDIDGVIHIITQAPPALAHNINKSLQKEDPNLDEPSEKKENFTESVEESTTSEPELVAEAQRVSTMSNQPTFNEDEDYPGPINNQQTSSEQPQKLSTEEQRENEEKKKLILDTVDQLKIRHEEEQRAIAEKNKQDEYENELRHRKKKKSQRKIVKTTPPNYDEYEDMSWNNKYKINVEKKQNDYTDTDTTWMSSPTEKTRPTSTQRPASYDRKPAQYSLFKNPNLFTVNDDEGDKISAKKNLNAPRRFSSKYNRAKNVITPATTTESPAEPILYFPKRKQRKLKYKTTVAPDSYVAETVEDKLTNKQTTESITFLDTGNDGFIPGTPPLWKDDTEEHIKTTTVFPEDTTPMDDVTALDVSAPSANAEASSNSVSVSDAVPASSDHKSEEPKDYHVKKEDTTPLDDLTALDVSAPSANDAVPASSDHKSEEPKDYHVKKGGGREHHSSFEEEHEEHGKKAYEGLHKDSKTKKGHHDKEDHLGKYEDHGGHDKQHHDESGHYGAHHHEEQGKKHAKYEESGKHSKGHSTKGSHDIHKKEEYEKNVEFFEEDGDSAEEEKHGGYHNEKKHESGGSFKKGKLHADHNENKKGESGHFKKGHHNFLNKGHKTAVGHEGHGKHHGAHHNAEGHQRGKKWVYHHGSPAKNSNLFIIDRRADRYVHGPNYYG